ncbi:MAG: glycosyltransferase family 4 protein [Salinibacter sp.]|uniref:glycosyltransferase family 4 protein n=1 Tax=Salinibacter sp. TaxID=2065818 RepID=UPI0035D4167B
MRILVLAPQPFYQPRGTPIAVRMLVETLAEAGHEVDLLTYHEGESVPLGDAQLHRIPSLPFIQDIDPGFSIEKVVCDVVMAARAAQIARSEDYDVIHAVEEASFIARGLRWLTRTPYVFDMDSSMPEQIVNDYRGAQLLQPFMEAMEAWAIHGSEAVVVVCEALEDRVREVDSNMPVLRLEDVSMLDDTEVEEDLRQDLSVEGKILMYVGNLKRYQGIDLLIDAFHLVSEGGEEAHLVVIGGSDRRIETYRDRAVERGVADRVHFLGPRPLEHLGAYLRQADILVSPRTQGTNTPMKIYSYLDSGRPVVATRKRTHTQVLDDEIAMLAEPTPNAMAEALRRLLRDENLRERLAVNAQERVAEEYSPEAFRRKLTDFYETLEQDILSHGGQDGAEPLASTEQ